MVPNRFSLAPKALGLLCYLGGLIWAMLTFDYFLQTTEISGLNGFTEMPDVILCTTQASVKVGDWYDEQGLSTDGPQIRLTSWTWVNGGNDNSMPIFSRPACADRHDGITIASFGEQSFNRSSLAALRLIVTPNDPASNDVRPTLHMSWAMIVKGFNAVTICWLCKVPRSMSNF